MKIEELFGGNITDPISDPYRGYAWLRAQSPCHVFETTFGDMYMATRYENVRHVLERPETFSSRINNERLIGIVVGNTIVGMDGAAHLRMRRLVAPAFSPRTIEGLRTTIQALVQRSLDAIGHARPVDLVEQCTFTLPLDVVAHIIGVPIENAVEFRRWARSILAVATNPGQAFAAVANIHATLLPIIVERRRNPHADILSTLIAAEVDGERLSDDEIVSFLTLLFQAGAETTSSILGNALFLLLKHNLWEYVVHHRILLESVWKETLRFESPVQFVARETAQPTALNEVAIPAGAFVVAVIGSAHRDQKIWHYPNEFLIDRDPKEWEQTIPFGMGPHYCIGSHLARLEFFEVMNALMDRFPRLCLDTPHQVGIVGFAFRAPQSLRVCFV